MGIRFCAGIEDELTKITIGKNVFIDAHRSLQQTSKTYLSVCDKKMHYLCSCYDDFHQNAYIKYCTIMESSYFAKQMIKSRYPTVTIVSFNELALSIMTLFQASGCIVYCKGELWDSYVSKKAIVDEVQGFAIYTEGHTGLELSECGMWANTFPENEFGFIKDTYEECKLYHQLYNKPWASARDGNDTLSALIQAGTPFMAARLGNTEAAICQNFLDGYYLEKWLNWLYSTSGFFSLGGRNIQDVDLYAETTIDAIKDCDIHMCRFENEINLINQFASPNSILLDWYALYTDLSEQSWLYSLKGKRVLIISSAIETIQSQYNKRTVLFEQSNVLPDMDLLFYLPPQTQLASSVTSQNWFETFDAMCDDIANLHFDVAIIAAGAYGYPLSCFIKAKLKKQAIELCSGIYPIFGIKVKAQVIIRRVSKMYNRFWVFPKENKPVDYMKIENGAYWG